MGVLSEILESKRAEIRRLRSARFPAAPPLRVVSLKRSIGDPMRIFAEIKRRSPSAGALSTRLSVAERAAAYERGGAALISVLCDGPYFDGAFEHLAEARGATSLPILCKDFILDEVQLDAARAFGADTVLLIVRYLQRPELRRLLAAARARDLLPLVEAHDSDEARVALDEGAEVVGVNARDLDTLSMDAEAAQRVLDALPSHIVRVHLSGVSAPAGVRDIARRGIDAALVGEALMRQDDPEPLLRELVAAG
jgi:indole-3-glycerol phosphate synthase